MNWQTTRVPRSPELGSNCGRWPTKHSPTLSSWAECLGLGRSQGVAGTKQRRFPENYPLILPRAQASEPGPHLSSKCSLGELPGTW